MDQPKIVILDLKKAVDRFKDTVVKVFQEDNFVDHVLDQLIDHLEDWSMSEVYVNELAKEIIVIYDFIPESAEADAVLRGVMELARAIRKEIELHDLVRDDALYYSYKTQWHGGVVLRSCI